eukprot:22175-Hanusia_phi.AAC.1
MDWNLNKLEARWQSVGKFVTVLKSRGPGKTRGGVQVDKGRIGEGAAAELSWRSHRGDSEQQLSWRRAAAVMEESSSCHGGGEAAEEARFASAEEARQGVQQLRERCLQLGEKEEMQDLVKQSSQVLIGE